MTEKSYSCIENYIAREYLGGLIGLSDLADYCGKSEAEIYVEMISLKEDGCIEIVKRYFCPEGHLLTQESIPYCEECDYLYSSLYIATLIYIQPLSMC
jgi:hypothetical protein